jgi:hypothetical protein
VPVNFGVHHLIWQLYQRRRKHPLINVMECWRRLNLDIRNFGRRQQQPFESLGLWASMGDKSEKASP